MGAHMREQRFESPHPAAEQTVGATDGPLRTPEFGVWLKPVEAQAFIPCKSLKATYEWFRRHGIKRRSNGTVARRDLERELNRPRKRRVMAAASLANLRRKVSA